MSFKLVRLTIRIVVHQEQRRIEAGVAQQGDASVAWKTQLETGVFRKADVERGEEGSQQ